MEQTRPRRIPGRNAAGSLFIQPFHVRIVPDRRETRYRTLEGLEGLEAFLLRL